MKKRCQVMSADSAEQREKSVRFGVHAFRDFRVSPNAEPDERSGSAYRPNFEPDHRSGSASVRSEPKFGTELCHHYALLIMLLVLRFKLRPASMHK